MTDGIIALNPQQLLAFLKDPLDGSGPCKVNEALDWEILRSTGLIPGARLLLRKLAEAPAKLTGHGYLNRKLVEALMDGVQWPWDEVERVRSICKVFNEYDFIPANFLHAL